MGSTGIIGAGFNFLSPFFQQFLVSPSLFSNSLMLVTSSRILVLLLELFTQLCHLDGTLAVGHPQSVTMRTDMNMVVFKFVLAKLTVIGVRDNDVQER